MNTEFKGTKGKFRIMHYAASDVNGLKCIGKEKGITYFSGKGINESKYVIVSDCDPVESSIPADFTGSIIAEIIDFKHQDGGIESLANVKLLGASKILLQALEMAKRHINIFTPAKHKNPELTELIDLALNEAKNIE